MTVKLLQRTIEFFRKGSDRTLKAKKNIVAMILIKGINIAISFLYIPLLINILDTDLYGVWITLTSIIAWINLFDIGLGNGLRNRLSESLAREDKLSSRIYISTAYFAIGIFCVFLASIFLLTNQILEWSIILNAPPELNATLSKLVVVVFIMFLLQFFLKIINSILLAFQLPAYSSFLVMLGQVFSFAIVYIAANILNIKDILHLGTLISIVPILTLTFATFILFSTRLKDYRPSIKLLKLKYLKDILGLGIEFFVLQIITIIFYQSSNLIIAHIIGPEGVTEYNLAYKYMGIISMAFIIIITPFWSAATEAYQKNDINWIKKTIKGLNKIWLILVVFGFVLFFSSKFIYKIWIGDKIVPEFSILFLSLVYFALNMQYSLYGYILNGIGKIRFQLIITSVLAVIFIPSAIILTRLYGLEGIFLSLIFVALTNSIWSNIQLKKIINNKAVGLWNK